MPILYSAIIEAGQVKGQYPTKGSNFEEIITQKIVPRIEMNNHRRTLTQGKYDFHYKYSGTLIYFCVAEETAKRICWSFIDDIEQKYLKDTRSSASATSKLLNTRMKFYNDPKNDKIAAVQSSIDDVKDVMIDNMDKLLARGESIEVLVQKTDDIQIGASEFRKGTNTVKKQMLVRLIVVVIVLILIIVAIILAIGLGVGLGIKNAIPPGPPATSAPAPGPSPTIRLALA